MNKMDYVDTIFDWIAGNWNKKLSGFQIGSDLIGENTPHDAGETKTKRERMYSMDYVDTIFDWINGGDEE